MTESKSKAATEKWQACLCFPIRKLDWLVITALPIIVAYFRYPKPVENWTGSASYKNAFFFLTD